MVQLRMSSERTAGPPCIRHQRQVLLSYFFNVVQILPEQGRLDSTTYGVESRTL